MAWYLVKRVLQLIPVFIGATLLVYLLVFLLPGDALAALCGDKGCSPGVAAALTRKYHLNDPFFVQYLHYLGGLFTGNLGVNFSGRPIGQILASAYPVTARLAIEALLFEGIFGIAFGLIAGLRKGKIFDSTVLVVSLVAVSIPVFVLGFVLQFFIGVRLGWAKPTVSGQATWMELILPAIVLGLVSFANVLRLTRTSVAENANADYVRTATAKGLTRERVIGVHILRNSMIPVVTFLGTDLGALMGGAVVTEGIFNVPGIGSQLYKALTLGDAPTVVSLVSVLVLVFCVANLLVDLLYAWLDPRIRYA